MPGGWELVLILLVIVVVFGSKRLPDTARSLGRSMRILKAETRGLRDDDAVPQPVQQLAPPTQSVQPSQPGVIPPVPQVPFTGQQVFDAEGRPVQLGATVAPAPQEPSAG